MRKIVKRKGGLIYPVLLQEFTEAGKTVYLAEIPDLPGCMSHGRTPAEAIKNVEEARRLWIKARKEEGLPIPPPTEMVEFSGKFLLRTPKSLHRNLTHRAAENGVSLNQYAVMQLAEASAVDALRQDLGKLAEAIHARVDKLAEVVRLLENNLASSLAQLSFIEGTVSFRTANVMAQSRGLGQTSTWIASLPQSVQGMANIEIPPRLPGTLSETQQPVFLVPSTRLRKPVPAEEK